MTHAKWAFMKSNDPKTIGDALHRAFGVTDIEVIESTIDDKDGNKILDIWVLEFDIDEDDLETLKRIMKLDSINGYIM